MNHLTPEQIAALPTEAERAAAIREYGNRVFDDTKRMVDGYIGRFSAFVNEYKEVRRAQALYFKTRTQADLTNSKNLEKALDLRAASLFNQEKKDAAA